MLEYVLSWVVVNPVPFYCSVWPTTNRLSRKFSSWHVKFSAKPLHDNLWYVSLFAGKETKYIQKKQTIYPEFKASFDAHLYKGRVLQFILMERPQKLIADATIEAHLLASKADQNDNKVVNLWVSIM